jgi:hypothetical protein
VSPRGDPRHRGGKSTGARPRGRGRCAGGRGRRRSPARRCSWTSCATSSTWPWASRGHRLDVGTWGTSCGTSSTSSTWPARGHRLDVTPGGRAAATGSAPGRVAAPRHVDRVAVDAVGLAARRHRLTSCGTSSTWPWTPREATAHRRHRGGAATRRQRRAPGRGRRARPPLVVVVGTGDELRPLATLSTWPRTARGQPLDVGAGDELWHVEHLAVDGARPPARCRPGDELRHVANVDGGRRARPAAPSRVADASAPGAAPSRTWTPREANVLDAGTVRELRPRRHRGEGGGFGVLDGDQYPSTPLINIRSSASSIVGRSPFRVSQSCNGGVSRETPPCETRNAFRDGASLARPGPRPASSRHARQQQEPWPVSRPRPLLAHGAARAQRCVHTQDPRYRSRSGGRRLERSAIVGLCPLPANSPNPGARLRSPSRRKSRRRRATMKRTEPGCAPARAGIHRRHRERSSS